MNQQPPKNDMALLPCQLDFIYSRAPLKGDDELLCYCGKLCPRHPVAQIIKEQNLNEALAVSADKKALDSVISSHCCSCERTQARNNEGAYGHSEAQPKNLFVLYHMS